ncbi:NDP-hexose 2,3-dehydratase family protein [Desulfosporosinus sp. Sb-LF]|uniref:NDP-hexose 2,3-dehydratase family protein n=1 Tax=Desulfosporosinus sp. Sb-LF TaxID=2560027 RepID=UPI00107F4816|nr:NDP-hexose 2,3-dehydratase family protein [Desulfosporosinus sp. Sb-LF]TGE33791.1 dNDP-4-keto-6-deoxy-glucose-2,3- dehydratase [Desulfosporosinus sp. Sb-LF]
MNKTIIQIVESWANIAGNVNTTENILEWVRQRNQEIAMSIQKVALEESDFWFYDQKEGIIVNKNQSFFQIKGLICSKGDTVIFEQPVILQDEIGFLGILCKEINGVLNFLMQAKIEPGNINKIQLSPTIQATKSNFTRKHGGAQPAYLEYFIHTANHDVIVDQIQSEQSSRFLKKRNRNVMIKVDDEVEVLPSHKWMTLGQLKELMKHDNLVNMDTRTVISCIPFCTHRFSDWEMKRMRTLFRNEVLFRSVFEGNCSEALPEIYHYINNYKMFEESRIKLVPLDALTTWDMRGQEYVCQHDYPFKVVFCNISIEGREVKEWTQPLFEATGMATFGLFVCNDNGVEKFLVRARSEVGCFDKIELGPTVQMESTDRLDKMNVIDRLFLDKKREIENIRYQVILSEEGGRFYHEQNDNIILEIDKHAVPLLPDGYFWADYYALNMLIQVNNCVNIQLRNLLALLEV